MSVKYWEIQVDEKQIFTQRGYDTNVFIIKKYWVSENWKSVIVLSFLVAQIKA